MAEAMARCFIGAGMARPDEITVSDISGARRRALGRIGIKSVASNRAVLNAARAVFLAVKPQDMDDVLREVAPFVSVGHLVISIAAGRRTDRIEALLPRARVLRVMPNLPVTVAHGMSVFCAGRRATAADRKMAARLLAAMGSVIELPEGQFHAVTALSGSGPAFFARFQQMMADAGVRLGLKRDAADLLALQTMAGTAELLCRKRLAPAELIAAVSSRKGTTVAGLAAMNSSPMAGIVNSTLAAAARRSRELAR